MADDLDLDSAVSYVSGNRPARAAVVGNIAEDPDKAARAVQLSQTTGVPAPVIHADLDNFEQMQKARVSADLVVSNPHISAYVNSDPMAAKVSNDDLGQLDNVSQAVSKIGGESILGAAMRGFKEGLDYEGLNKETQDYFDYGQSPNWKAFAALTAPAAAALAGSQHLLTGILQGGSEGLATAWTSLTGQGEAQKNKLVRDLMVLGQVGMAGTPEGMHPAIEPSRAYIAAGKEPPVGLHPELDSIKETQAKIDLDNLNEAVKQAQTSTTHERAPAMFDGFVKQHVGERTIGIHPDAVRELYGNKVPEEGDGLLGFVPDLADQMLRGTITGADIQVPVHSWITYVDPQVEKLLEPAIRTRPDGVAQVDLPAAEATVASATDTIRQASAIPSDIQLVEKANALGMTEAQYVKYQKLIAKRQEEDFAKAQARAEAAERKRQSTEWAANRKEMFEQVRNEYAETPAIEADEFIRSGGMEKLDVDALPKEAPIQQYRREAAAINEEMPPPKDGNTRLWRGNRPGEVGKNPQFTNSLDGIALPFRKMYGGDLSYIDVPTERLSEFEQHGAVADGSEFVVSPEIAVLAKSVAVPEVGITDKFKKAFFKRNGLHPDAAAQIFGYDSGDALIRDLAELHAAREASGLDPKAFLKQLIDTETDRRMEAKYGDLDENVLVAAKEQVLSATQLDLLHAETEALAGGQLPLTKERFRADIKESFGRTKVSNVSSDALLATAGRAGRAVEAALLNGDAAEAFRQKQRQYAAIVASKEAMKVEKAQEQFKKLAKTWGKKEVSGAPQEYLNWIQDTLVRLGQRINNNPLDVQLSISKSAHKTLADFVETKEYSPQGIPGRDFFVPEFMKDPNFRTNANDLTVDQFMQMTKAMKALAHNARDENKIIKAGEKVDFEATRDAMIDVMKSFPAKLTGIDKPEGYLSSNIKSAWWSSINLESVLNRLDRGDPSGLFNQTLVRMYTEANGDELRMLKEYDARLTKLTKISNLDKLVENNLFMDPRTNYTVPLKMSRRNVLGVLQNVGNESNLRKLAEGFKIDDPAKIFQWLEQHTTKEDWDRAQQIGDLFNELHDMADNMSRNLNGEGINKIDIQPITSKYGTYKGWYNPVDYDHRFSQDKSITREDRMKNDGFYKATTNQSYTKDRTGYIAPIDLNTDIVPVRMKQMIHDIATRPAVVQLGKFFDDKKFTQAFKDHVGLHQEAQLEPFLRDFAGSANFRSNAEGLGNEFVSRMSSNMVTTMIGANPDTFSKHGLTAFGKSLFQHPVGFTKELLTLLKADPETADTNWRMAINKSDLLNSRVQNLVELIEGHSQDLSLRSSDAKGIFKTARALAKYYGGYAISAFDLLSAVPTWLATYKRAIAAGEDEGMAKFLADRDVRKTHGSNMITNKPQIMRSKNATVKSFAMFYGFFSENLQVQYEVGWRMKDAYNMLREDSVKTALKEVPTIAGLVFTSSILPALVEQAVVGKSDKDEGWGKWAGETLFRGLTSSMIGFRDLANAVLDHRDPSLTTLSSIAKGYTDVLKDLIPDKHGHIAAMTPAKTGNFLKHFNTMVGMGTGLTFNQVGKVEEFLYNYYANREHPKGPWDVMQGLHYGTTKNHSHSFDEWQRSLTQ